MSQGSQQIQLFVTSNQRTPSTKRHINSLPPELLLHIFGCYCTLRYSALPLLLVCRLWYAIASDCSALWGNIYYNPDAYHHGPFEKSPSEIELRQKRIFCDTWAKFQWAAKRAGTAPLNLQFSFVDTHKLRERQGSDILLLTRCRELALLHPKPAIAFLNNLPALEHLEFHQSFQIDQLFDGIEQGSPLLWSLKLTGMSSIACLEHLSTLLRRIQCPDVDVHPAGCSDEFIMGLQNLTELTPQKTTNPSLSFSKAVVSDNLEYPARDRREHGIPVLDRLTLQSEWSSLPLIVAPKLTKLILRGWVSTMTRPNLLAATVRPTSLVIFYPPLDIDLPELLSMWSDLLELHLGYYREVDMSHVQLATLGGNSDRGRLCPHLRYLTVHVTHWQRDAMAPVQIIQTLQTIVEERKRYDTDELQRVMCVWDWFVSYTGQSDEPKEIEWVDVL